MFSVVFLALAAGAYCAGSIPVHRFLGLTDIDHATYRNQRVRALSRVLLNIVKGLIVVEIGAIYGPSGAMVATFGVCIGHNYPIWSSFRGGTGLGTILGALIALDPLLGLHTLVAWITVYYVFTNNTAAAVSAASVAPLSAVFLNGSVEPVALLPISALTFWRHRHQIADLFIHDAKATEDAFKGL